METSMSLSPIQMNEQRQQRPSIELKHLSTIRASKSSSSKTPSNKSNMNQNLKPPLNPKISQANISSSGSGSGIQRSGGSKTSSNQSKYSKNIGEQPQAQAKPKGLKIFSNKFNFNITSNSSPEWVLGHNNQLVTQPSPVEFMDAPDNKFQSGDNNHNDSIPQ